MLGAASVIVDDRDCVLLVHHTYGERNWEIPGGAGQPGESAEETARREAREEVGIEIEIGRVTGVYWDPAAGMHHFVFSARILGSPRPSDRDEVDECGWFARGQLPRPISDFTCTRIADALSGAPALLRTIGPRVWLR